MKKFLVYLLAIVIVAAMGFSIFYLVRDDEVLSITNTSLYKEVGDDIVVGVNVKKPKSYTKIKLNYAGDTDIVKQVSANLNPSKGEVTAKLKATGGGTVRINFQTNNSKFRNLYCDVMIGDGSVENPYYISTAEQLLSIGRDGSKYSADLNYELISNINLANLEDGTWDPATVAFTGKLNGNGYAIQNMSISATSGTNLGLFGEIGVGGVIDNVAFEGVSISVPSTGNYNVGVVAGVNHGTISRINVKSASIRSNNSNAVIGGVVAVNETTQSNDGDRAIARIDRAGVNLDLAYANLNSGTGAFDYSGIKGLVGGITAKNNGGTVINCYSVGSVNVANSAGTSFAGVVNTNTTVTFVASSKYNSVYQAANVKDCYSAVTVTTTQDGANTGAYKVSGVINTNSTQKYTDSLTGLDFDYNQVVGNYYAKEMLVSSDPTHTITSGMADVEYGVTGLELSKMQNEREFVSHVEYRFVKDQSTGKVTKVPVTNEDGSDKVIYWNFSAVWDITGSVNNGLPYLTYDNVSVSDALYSATTYVEVATREALIAILSDATRNDTIYLITADIDMSGYAWTPIGSLENPFKGTISGAVLANGEYPTISNLSVNQTTVDGYAGFIGVMESPAIVENLNFTDITVVGDEFNYAGAVAASNGYISGKQTISGGTIRNITVKDASVEARIAAGGIVGANYGDVVDVKVFSSDDAEKFVLVSTTPNGEYAYVGGIAGINAKSISATSGRNLVKNRVIIVAYANASNYFAKVRLGGVAGTNTGSISGSAVATSGTDHGITTTNEITGDPEQDTSKYNFADILAGGVAGESDGRIVGAYVSTNINISTTSDKSLAGGITATINKDANNFNAATSKAQYEANYSVFNSVVFNSSISAYKVGGLVATMNVKNCAVEAKVLRQDGWDLFNSGNQKLYEAFSVNKDSSNQLFSNIVSCVVTNVTLTGEFTGGFVCNLEAGVVTDCSAEVIFNGSRNAGFAYTIDRQNGVAGVIARSYGIFTFGGGTNYQVTSSDVHQVYIKSGMGGNSDLDAKTSGFVVDYAYTVVKGSANKPNLYFDADYYDKVCVSLDKLKNSDLFKNKDWNSASWLMKECNDKVSYWTLTNGSLPVQTALAGYRGIIENLVA